MKLFRNIEVSAYGRRDYRLIKNTILCLKMASFFFLLLPLLYRGYETIIVTLSITPFLFLSEFWLPGLWKKMEGAGIDAEMPAFLAYLMPYARSSRGLVDLMISIPKSLKLRFIESEVERLRRLINMGMDSRKALKTLAKTTPNQRLGKFLFDYLNAEYMGTTKHSIVSLLYDYAISSLKEKWNAYAEFGRGVVEIGLGLTLSFAIVISLAPIAGPNIVVSLAIIAFIIIPLMSIGLIITMPKIGGEKRYDAILSLVPALLTSAMLAEGFGYISLIPLLVAAPFIEAYNASIKKKASKALESLKLAAEKAKIGKRFDEELYKARFVAGNIAEAIISSEKIAGKMGVSNAIEKLEQLIEESERLSESLRIQSILMIAVSIASLIISILSINFISSIYASIPQGINVGAVAVARNLIISLSPIVTFPSSILYKERVPSLLPSLVSAIALLFIK
ncbi:MAG: hypothetical protein F7B11_03890 [Caldisphaeraceae archaeon]|nr:hypothetical protein [Caldisphaeraceae archaeon]